MSEKIKYYQDKEKSIIDPKLLDSKAHSKGKELQNITSHQIRRFFNEIKSLEKKKNVQGWDKVMPLVKMVKAKAFYATSDNKADSRHRDDYKKWRAFLVDAIDSIEDQKDFEAFVKYFEAVIGFYYGEGRKK